MHLSASRTLQLENAPCAGRLNAMSSNCTTSRRSSPDPPSHRLRDPAALAPSAAWPGATIRVHPDRRGQRLILPIGDWVLRTAAAQHKAWQQAGLGSPMLAVNVSPVQFRQPQLARTIRAVLEEIGLEPAALELELTESVVSADPEEAVKIMEQLDRLGVQLAVDDFGTGYSLAVPPQAFPDRQAQDRSEFHARPWITMRILR